MHPRARSTAAARLGHHGVMVGVASPWGGVGSIGTRASLVAVLLSTVACRETRVDFAAEHAWIDVDRDSGDVVLGSGASIRVQTQAFAGYTVRASGLAKKRGSRLEPIEDSGSIVVEGHFDLEVSAAVDLPVGSFSGPVTAPPFDFEVEIAAFDPFLIGESVTVIGGMPAKDIMRAPLFPGVFLVLETAPGSFIPTFEGVCLEIEGGAVQYTGMIAIEPDFRYIAYIEIVVPLAGTEVIGPVGIELDFPPLVLQALDLGTFSMSSGDPVEGVQPCGEVDAATDAGSEAGSGSGESGGADGASSSG